MRNATPTRLPCTPPDLPSTALAAGMLEVQAWQALMHSLLHPAARPPVCAN
jgi:hypothetical protein